MSRKERAFRRPPLINQEKRVRRLGRKLDTLLGQGTFKNPIGLKSEVEIIDHEDDLAMLIANERQYLGASQESQIHLNIFNLLSSWGASEAELIELMQNMSKQKGQDRINLYLQGVTPFLKGDRGRAIVIQNIASSYRRLKYHYEDEFDEILNGESEFLKEYGLRNVLKEQLRSQGETLALVRMQIDYLKKKKKKVPDGRYDDRLEHPLVATIETVEGVESADTETSTAVEEHFGLFGWEVFWTTRKFSDSAGPLVQLPTDSRRTFVESLERINRGKQIFQIKSESVASCIEMWDIPEYRQRAQGSRFKWGPDYVREWSKLVRGPVRIMVKSDGEAKKLIFFAADRDTVYRGIFAGMSS